MQQLIMTQHMGVQPYIDISKKVVTCNRKNADNIKIQLPKNMILYMVKIRKAGIQMS